MPTQNRGWPDSHSLSKNKISRIYVPNWKDFQHYGNRKPPWIKLYRGLLDDFDYHCLPVLSKAIAPLLWLLASESYDGSVEADYDKIGFRLRMSTEDVKAGLAPLIDKGFFLVAPDASAPLALSERSACPEREKEKEKEKEREEEREEETEDSPPPARAANAALLNDFSSWYAKYPRKVAPRKAESAYLAARKRGATAEELVEGLERYMRTKPSYADWAHPATWLSDDRWKDGLNPTSSGDQPPPSYHASLQPYLPALERQIGGPALRTWFEDARLSAGSTLIVGTRFKATKIKQDYFTQMRVVFGPSVKIVCREEYAAVVSRETPSLSEIKPTDSRAPTI